MGVCQCNVFVSAILHEHHWQHASKASFLHLASLLVQLPHVLLSSPILLCILCMLQDAFLRDPPSVLDPESAHFVVRANPRVQPLSAGVSYTQATPPPTSKQRAGGPSSAAGAAAGQRPAHSRPQHVRHCWSHLEAAVISISSQQTHCSLAAARHIGAAVASLALGHLFSPRCHCPLLQ